MKYASTRGAAPALGLGAALAAGLAPDGGLYVPQSLPHFTPSDFDDCDGLAAVASRLLQPFFARLEDAMPLLTRDRALEPELRTLLTQVREGQW